VKPEQVARFEPAPRRELADPSEEVAPMGLLRAVSGLPERDTGVSTVIRVKQLVSGGEYAAGVDGPRLLAATPKGGRA
jgi:hypothetical protein